MPWRPLVACVVQCPRHSYGWTVVMRVCLQDSQISTWKLCDWYITMILRFRAFYFASGIYTKYKQFLSKDKLIFRRLSKVCILVLCAILPLDVTVNFNPYDCAVAEKLRNICLEDHMCLLKCCMNVKTKILLFLLRLLLVINRVTIQKDLRKFR